LQKSCKLPSPETRTTKGIAGFSGLKKLQNKLQKTLFFGTRSFRTNEKHKELLQKQNKRALNLSIQGSNVGAAGQIRTADLILTKYLFAYYSLRFLAVVCGWKSFIYTGLLKFACHSLLRAFATYFDLFLSVAQSFAQSF